MKLEENHEIIGTLVSIKNDGRCTKLLFSVQKTFEIPIESIPIKTLESVVGNRIGIFNAGDGIFKLRRANKK